nr:YlxR family protein [Cellulomonas bogoriensis]
MAGSTGPVRTCVGCRGRGQRSVLTRVVRVDDDGVPRAVVDPGRRLPGRGAWLHHDLQCLELAERRRALPRALRVGGLDTSPVRAVLEGGGGHQAAATSVVIEKESGLEADGHPMSTQR